MYLLPILSSKVKLSKISMSKTTFVDKLISPSVGTNSQFTCDLSKKDVFNIRSLDY